MDYPHDPRTMSHPCPSLDFPRTGYMYVAPLLTRAWNRNVWCIQVGDDDDWDMSRLTDIQFCPWCGREL